MVKTLAVLTALILSGCSKLGAPSAEEQNAWLSWHRWVVNDTLGMSCLVTHHGVSCVGSNDIPAR